jgi:SAM-dependent methyltransferase
MFNKAYGYILKHPATRRGYWGKWYYKGRYEKVSDSLSRFCGNSEKILDLGCGLGTYAGHLEKMGCQCYYVGCDIDAKALKAAYRGNNVDYIMSDLQQLPFVKRGANVVLCSEVLEHLPSPYIVLSNVCETASKTLIITFPEERILSVFGDRHPEHISQIDKEVISELLISKGFKLLRKSRIFTSFIPCGVLEFLSIPRNHLTETIVSLTDRFLKRITPSSLTPHTTILIEAEYASAQL